MEARGGRDYIEMCNFTVDVYKMCIRLWTLFIKERRADRATFLFRALWPPSSSFCICMRRVIWTRRTMESDVMVPLRAKVPLSAR